MNETLKSLLPETRLKIEKLVAYSASKERFIFGYEWDGRVTEKGVLKYYVSSNGRVLRLHKISSKEYRKLSPEHTICLDGRKCFRIEALS